MGSAQPSYIEIADTNCPLKTELCKTCPICNLSLPVSEFGINRQRASGRNLYCKACIRKKVADSRSALREFRQTQKQLRMRNETTTKPVRPARPLKKRYRHGVLAYLELKLHSNPDHERVFGAIFYGARTQKEIGQEAGLCNDAIGDALAILLLGHPKRIETAIANGLRTYGVRQVRNPKFGEGRMISGAG